MLQNLIKEIREISKPLDKDNQPKSKEAITRALNGILEKIDAMKSHTIQPYNFCGTGWQKTCQNWTRITTDILRRVYIRT